MQRATPLKYMPLGMLVLLLSNFSGCATGADFQAVASPPPGKALVYLFRERRVVGSAGMFNVYANKTMIVKMKSGGYFPYITDPGDLILSHEIAFGPLMILPAAIDRASDAKGHELLRLSIEANHTYYVEWKLGGWGKAPTMILRSEDYALPIIKECNLLKAAQ